MGIFYRCDRPGCKNESQFEMKTVFVSLDNSMSIGTYTFVVCPSCWEELQKMKIALDTMFWSKLEKEKA